jgi:hypothetical protein
MTREINPNVRMSAVEISILPAESGTGRQNRTSPLAALDIPVCADASALCFEASGGMVATADNVESHRRLAP